MPHPGPVCRGCLWARVSERTRRRDSPPPRKGGHDRTPDHRGFDVGQQRAPG
ncbi:hypothetical protein F4561_004123 [Lipingzhangella halophila]|uniref:Uncharacterized protein n=1 Tax=Lipingzhangella halophila TaxID=1783352 RepID=A0A7W7RJS8_9ACTN|nr:hypothetical protein [Lipingzhangella halophila]